MAVLQPNDPSRIVAVQQQPEEDEAQGIYYVPGDERPRYRDSQGYEQVLDQTVYAQTQSPEGVTGRIPVKVSAPGPGINPPAPEEVTYWRKRADGSQQIFRENAFGKPGAISIRQTNPYSGRVEAETYYDPELNYLSETGYPLLSEAGLQKIQERGEELASTPSPGTTLGAAADVLKRANANGFITNPYLDPNLTPEEQARAAQQQAQQQNFQGYLQSLAPSKRDAVKEIVRAADQQRRDVGNKLAVAGATMGISVEDQQAVMQRMSEQTLNQIGLVTHASPMDLYDQYTYQSSPEDRAAVLSKLAETYMSTGEMPDGLAAAAIPGDPESVTRFISDLSRARNQMMDAEDRQFRRSVGMINEVTNALGKSFDEQGNFVGPPEDTSAYLVAAYETYARQFGNKDVTDLAGRDFKKPEDFVRTLSELMGRPTEKTETPPPSATGSAVSEPVRQPVNVAPAPPETPFNAFLRRTQEVGAGAVSAVGGAAEATTEAIARAPLYPALGLYDFFGQPKINGVPVVSHEDGTYGAVQLRANLYGRPVEAIMGGQRIVIQPE